MVLVDHAASNGGAGLGIQIPWDPIRHTVLRCPLLPGATHR